MSRAASTTGVTVILLCATSSLHAEEAASLLKSVGVKGGLVVHLGCGDGKLMARLRVNDSYLVHGLDASRGNVRAARERMRSQGLYGPVSVDVLEGGSLPYRDNLVNLVVADDLGGVPMKEVMRVLAPLGVAYVKGKKTIKPWPDDIDEWTHYLHGPDNNAVAQDGVVGPPRTVQWVCGPAWARHHDSQAFLSALVSSRGRMFYILDEAPTTLVHIAPRWSLVARDAFSGVFLWRRSVRKWVSHLRYFRTGPTHLPRRLVADGESVYVTLGYGEPVSVLDAATGATTKKLPATDNAEEILCNNGVVFVVVAPEQKDSTAAVVSRRSRNRGEGSESQKRTLMALDGNTHSLLWQHSCVISSQTLAALGDKVFYHSADQVVCVDARTGAERWRSSPQKPKRGKSGPWYASTLVATEKAVLLTRGNSMWAFSAQDGKLLWSAPVRIGFLSSSDVFVIDGLVWSQSADHRFPIYEARDVMSGTVKKTINTAAVWRPGHHHRCYRNRATTRFIITSKRGLEFLDLGGKDHTDDVWVRGECQYGIMPCNGLTYAPPHPCMCYSALKINGFYALAREHDRSRDAMASRDRLHRGPEYAHASRLASSQAPARGAHDTSTQKGALWSPGGITDNSDWPEFRHDPARSGSTRMALPHELRMIWRAKLGTRLSALVSSGGKVCVALPEQHAVQALDAATGDALWSFTAGGPVDSPPSIHGKLAVFGSADGCVYCVSAENGELVWRFRAAPTHHRIVSYSHLESIWPVHGSVLIHPASKPGEKTVYCAAGRSGHLDGGMHLYGLALETGATVCENLVNLHSPEHSQGLSSLLSDVPVANGTGFNIRRATLNSRAEAVRNEPLNSLWGVTGLLDNSIDHRSFWVLGSASGKTGSGAPSIPRATGIAPYAKMFSFDARYAYGFRVGYDIRERMTPDHHQNFSKYKREQFPIGGVIFSVENTLSPAGGIPAATYAKGGKDKERRKWRWAVDTRLQVRAMLLASDRLFVAGWHDSLTPGDPCAVAEGRLKGALLVMSATDGRQLAEYGLPSPPVFDGMIAARDRLFLSLKNGDVVCFGR